MYKNKSNTGKVQLIITLFFAVFFTYACATVGKDFSSESLSWIILEKTTKNEVRSRLGEPFRVGVDDEKPTWTYGYYKYRAIGSTRTKDLVFYFNDNFTVYSYTFSTSFPAEKDKWLNKVKP